MSRAEGEYSAGGRPVGEMVATLVRAFVENSEAVQVSEKAKAGSTAVELRVAPEDLGKVIGRQGRTARALRSVLGLASEKLQRRCHLHILE